MSFYAAARTALAVGLLAQTTACSALPDRPVFGLSEYVYISELGQCYPAKIDTGAGSASLNAINIKLDKGPNRGDDVVHFDLVLPDDTLKSFSLPVSKYIRVQRRAADIEKNEKDYHLRPAVELTLQIGGNTHKLAVNLADRRDFKMPLLIGAKPLQAFDAMVDVNASYLQGNCLIASDTEQSTDTTTP
jgi:hypothetical protein